MDRREYEARRFAEFCGAYRKEIARLKSERNWCAGGFAVLFVIWLLTIAVGV